MDDLVYMHQVDLQTAMPLLSTVVPTSPFGRIYEAELLQIRKLCLAPLQLSLHLLPHGHHVCCGKRP